MPFLLSVVLVGIAFYVRLQVAETPAFAALDREREASRVPVLDMIREP